MNESDTQCLAGDSDPVASHLARRDFHQLLIAALAGAVAVPTGDEVDAAAGKAKPKDESNPLLSEPHVCRGLNTCKGLGAGKNNACAGQGTCATAPHHTCAAQNDCRGLGACYEGDPGKGEQPDYPGENTCKGLGGCHVPLEIQTDPRQRKLWEKVRQRFKALMKDVKNVEIGTPPPL